MSIATKRFFGKGNPGDEKKTPIRFNRVFDPEFIRERLEKANESLRDAEKEKFGMYRGRDYMQKLLREEAPSKRKRARINAQVTMAKIATLVFERFALQQGQVRLKEVKPTAIAEAFFGPNTKQIITYHHARVILLELWRYGTSNLLENFRKEHLEKLGRTRAHTEKTKINREKWEEDNILQPGFGDQKQLEQTSNYQE